MKLRNCPACNSDNIDHYEYARCAECGMSGPAEDENGGKWNALPRHGDIVSSEPEHMSVRL